MPKKDKVIVIVVAYNSQKYWPDLMPLLTQEKYEDFDLEILVVDNDSNDKTVDDLETNYPTVKLIKNKENLGFVGANNIGYQYAKSCGADFIFLLNPDTVISPGWLKSLYNFSKHNKFGSLQPQLNLWPDKTKINTLGNTIHFLGFGYSTGLGHLADNKQAIKKINYSSGAGVWLSMDVLHELGYLFDDSMFMYLEDLDLGWSLSLLGYDNYLIPESVLYHKYEFSRGIKQWYWFERNRLWTMLKNYKIGTLILILPAWLIMELGQLFFATINHRLFDKLKSYQFLFSQKQWQDLLTKRRYIQSKRVRSDRQVVGQFSGLILFQPLESLLLKIANMFFNLYWQIIKLFIFW